MNCWSHRPRSSRTSHSIDKPLFIRWWPGLFVFTIWSATELKKKYLGEGSHLDPPNIYTMVTPLHLWQYWTVLICYDIRNIYKHEDKYSDVRDVSVCVRYPWCRTLHIHWRLNSVWICLIHRIHSMILLLFFSAEKNVIWFLKVQC